MNPLDYVAVGLSGLNTVLLLTMSFKAGRWMGAIETEVRGVQDDVKMLNRYVFRRDSNV